MQILEPTPQNLEIASQSLKQGECVGMPTETVYGLAANALDARAVTRIFEAKERPLFDPLIVHTPATRLEELGDLVRLDALSPAARAAYARLVSAFWPGPLTLIFPRAASIPDLVTSGLSSVAIRSPGHPVARALLKACALPLAAPSANRFGHISPTTAQDVAAELGSRVALTLDGGACSVGLESTVAVFDDSSNTLRVLRPGGVSIEALKEHVAVAQATTGGPAPQASPGMLPSHYAPRKRLWILGSSSLPLGRTYALLARCQASDVLPTHTRVATRVLSATDDFAEAARELFAALRALDATPADFIVAESFAETTGLGFAIHDRLTRAAAPRAPQEHFP